MLNFSLKDVRWGPVAIGWVVAVVSGVILSLIFGAIGLIASSSGTEAGTVTTGIFLSSLVVGFLAHVIGGYVAANRAGAAGTTNGMAVAIFGIAVFIVLGIILSIFGALFFDGQVPATPGFLGYAGGGFLTVIFSFIFNILGGYVGGRFGAGGGSSRSTQRPSRVR